MKMSLRTRLFAAVSLLVVFFVAFSWIMNSTYLEKYYIYQNKKQLIATAESIDASYRGDVEELAQEITRLEQAPRLNLLIFDSNLNLKYYALGAEGWNISGSGRRAGRRPESLLPLVVRYLPSLQAGDKVIAVSQDQNELEGLVSVVSVLNNGDYLLLSTPLVSIQESAAVANRFFLFTGLLTILIGLLAVYFFARNFTKPILELNRIAQKMAQLDFSARYLSHGEDELGELGNSINSLSAQLDESITELQAANQKLREDIEQERRIDQMRKQFVSNVSHELKTPIALIQGYAEGLKLDVAEDEASKNYYCDVITDEADKMNRMVKELLELSQIEAGYVPLKTSVFNIKALLQGALKKYDLILKDKSVEVELRAGEFWVEGDQARIEQVLGNYLNNAIDHVDDQKQIRVEAERADGKVRISVFNSGPPIPGEAVDKIFTSFYKLDEARTRALGGTGLGLSIVRAIMDQHRQ
ncbi:MAG: ATP-binding protein, partial [Syntrophomonadaceae bacterium]